MPTLQRTATGAYKARKRIPEDVREDYSKLHGQRYEAKLFIPPGATPGVAKQRYGDWLAEHEGRVAAIRAARTGEGVSLTERQARELAGEWYAWFTKKHEGREAAEHWEFYQDEASDVMRSAAPKGAHEDDLWQFAEVREALEPRLADWCETATFLALKKLTLNNKARRLFFDHLCGDFAAALRLLIRRANRDYGDDTHLRTFPTPQARDTGITAQQLFRAWVAARQPAPSTIESWRYVFATLESQVGDRSAGSITPDEADAWIKSLVTPKRSAFTVRNTWLRATRTVFGWAIEHRHVGRNPFTAAKVTVPKKQRLREKAFRNDELRTILSAASAIADTTRPDDAARRWVPWLLAYSGARPGEITQLRGSDVIRQDGIQALRITPEAGAVKGGAARTVPLHEHILAQGFLDFAASKGQGPLFHRSTSDRKAEDAMKQKKPRYAQTRQRLAAWVRGLGVTDPALKQPNHAWRHTFKQIGRRHMPEHLLDAIVGHAPANVGRSYGAPTLGDLADALKNFPRYSV